MKIGVLTHNYPRFRGDFSGRFVRALCEELAAQGHAVTVLAPWDPAYDAEFLAQSPGTAPEPVEGGAELAPFDRLRARADSGATPFDRLRARADLEPQPFDGLRARGAGQGQRPQVALELYRYAPVAGWHQLGYMRTMRADVALRRVTYLLAPGMFLAGIGAVARWAARERPDVLHAHWALPNGFIAAVVARRQRIPLVVSIPGSDATVAAANPLFRRMARFAFDTAGLVTANSAALRDVAINDLGADPARFDLIAYGVDPQALRPDARDTADLRARLGIPESAVVFLAVGRMVYKKGFDRLLRAAAQMANSKSANQQISKSANRQSAIRNPQSAIRNPQSIHLVLVGEGDLWAEWQALGRELGLGERVHWMGNVPADQIGVYYNMADALVMPSVTHPADGLNVTVLDAMSCAKPVVGTTAAGNELAIRDGHNGFLVPEADDAALAGALAALVADPALRSRLGAAGRRMIEAELGWPQLARRYVAHFERLARR